MTVRELLEAANGHTGVEIWRSDSCVPVIGDACYILEKHESAILDREVAEFEVQPISGDRANLAIYV